MFKTHLKTALRSVFGSMLYSGINIAGLAIGMACCLLILLFVRHELSYESGFANADRIYRISREYFPFDGARARVPASTNAPVAPALQQDFPAVESIARVMGGALVLARDDESYVEPGLRLADPALFEVFDFTWLAGDPESALATPDSLVLTESLARKYFGRVDILGETLRAMDVFDVRVTGVIADLPPNTHLDLSGVLSLQALVLANGPQMLEQWNSSTDYHTYFLLGEGSDVDSISSGIPAFMERHMGEGASTVSTLPIMNIRDIHLHSSMDEEWKEPGSIATVYSFAAVAFGILLIACINFMSIATARSAQRAREIGMRQSLGASRRALINQFLGESGLTALLASLLAVVLVELMLPTFRTFAGTPLDFNPWSNLPLSAEILGLTLFVALFAGSYPAFYLSGYQAARVLRGDFTRGLGGLHMRNALVVIQFTLAIALLASTVVIYQQQRLAQTIDMGFDKDAIVIVPSAAPNGYREDWPAFKAALLEHSAIEGVTASHYLPFGFNDNQVPLQKRGTAIETRIQYMMVDYDFFETYGIDRVSGRLFSAEMSGDNVVIPTPDAPQGRISFVLNRAAARALGIDPEDIAEAVLEVNLLAAAGPVIGVVDDTHFESIHRAVRPLVFILTPPDSVQQLQRMRNAAVRIQLDSLDAALSHIDATWRRIYPDAVNNRYFLERDFLAMYQAERKLGELFTAFSVLAILITCFGLFGLATFNAERRTKEIGVRKVMGGSVWRIVVLLTNDFSKLVLIANVIAWPLAWVAMNRWLEQFAYRIDLTPMIFIGSGLIALCVAWVTVGGTAARAACQKPVLALRYE